MKRIAWIAAVVIVAGAGPAAAQTLGDEVKTLLAEHPRLEAARKGVKAADEGVREAFAGYLPTLRLEGDQGYEVTDSPTRRAAGDPTLEAWRNSASVVATQNLFRGFDTDARHQSGKITRDLAEIAVDSARQGLLFDAADAYLDVLRRLKILELAVANEETIRQQLVLEDARVSIGSGASVDVLFAKSRLQIANERRVNFEGDLFLAFDKFNRVFGHLPETSKMERPKVPFDLLPKSVDDALQVAFVENPSIRDSERAVDLAAQRTRQAKSSYFPSLDLVGQANHQNDVAGIPGQRNDATVQLRMTWELYSGFATQASSARATYQHEASKDTRADIRRAVEEEVRRAWDQLATAEERFEVLTNAVNIATEVFAARQKLAETEREPLINVLDAQTEVFEAQIDAARVEFDMFILAFRVLRAIGRLDPQVFAAN
jgi:adhesin transport system outer membrane protein